MNTLKRKLQFFSTGGGKLKVVLPTEFSVYDVGEDFQIYIEKVKGEIVSVYIDSEKIKEIPVLFNQTAQGEMSVDDKFVGIGCAYLIEDEQEIPIGNITSKTIEFNDGKLKGSVIVNIISDKGFNAGEIKGSVKTFPDDDDNLYTIQFNQISCQIKTKPDDSDNIYKFDFEITGEVITTN